ncbi:MAG: 16S rRNA (cytidine(1402)-2'-O)-methyltransferase [Candidatus Nealsonbacteria bacterium RIFCSPLOWO2_01_FULL_43_32]|uniref:Ribosomal RNA small subunit methyltransferase I n=1 Tax=Candidatus Nealsonbacteria bacterium RIFCSPLOWO2_01_FULL_43_32 TaxID=1801672 RepID=A0A1G2EET7_9BACT|nr:MAG: 16S rRNA (cytidine(1402)-2'-O)-methyltransferase [Candidatus Nealsonbacteria bacterium RIFCSPLOWO2_01_FULL_43_32]
MVALYIVGTPIGNLKDISLRAIETLKEVDLILCEDTRVTKILLDHYEIKTPTLSYHQHSQLKKVEEIIQLLKDGKNLALVSDAGTPGIADPGGKLVESVVKALGDAAKIVSVPGTNAFIAAASISGFPIDRFVFLGFPPVKNKRKKFFTEAVSLKYPVVFFESKHRILKTLAELALLNKQLYLVVCRELTKQFETTYRGTVKEVLEKLSEEEIRGEFVVIIGRR